MLPLTCLPQLPRLSTGAAMLELVVHQLGQRLALPAVELGPFLTGQGAEAGEVLDTGTNLQKLKKRVSHVRGSWRQWSASRSWAPVENLQEGE